MSDRVYCTNPEHGDGEHSPSCMPPADPANPELRLIRAIWGLCPVCDETGEHAHPLPPGTRFRAVIPGIGLSNVEYEIIEFVRIVHGDLMYLAAPVGGGTRGYHAESGMQVTS